MKNRLLAILVLLIPMVYEYASGYCVPHHLRIADTLQHEQLLEAVAESGVEKSPARVSWESLSDAVSRDIQRFAEASCGMFCPDVTFAEFQETPDSNFKLSYLVNVM